jgi:hypothetical protein
MDATEEGVGRDVQLIEVEPHIEQMPINRYSKSPWQTKSSWQTKSDKGFHIGQPKVKWGCFCNDVHSPPFAFFGSKRGRIFIEGGKPPIGRF